MINLKSFEDFVNEYIRFSPDIDSRLNEGINSFTGNLYENITKISNSVCLVINDTVLAKDLESNKNEVYCIYYDNKLRKEFIGNNRYQYVELVTNSNKISVYPTKERIIDIFDNVWKLNREFKFDYIFNVSPKITSRMKADTIADLNAFICCYPFMDVDGKKVRKDGGKKAIIFRKGLTGYYSFDENFVMNSFDKNLYKYRGVNIENSRRMSSLEWNDFGFDDDTIRYFVRVFVEGINVNRESDKDEEVLNNRNSESIDMDERDFTADPSVGKEDSVFSGMREPKLYAFKSRHVDVTLNGLTDEETAGMSDKEVESLVDFKSIKVGDTNRTVAQRLKEWGKKFPDCKRLKSWDAVLRGCGDGIDGKIFRDYTIHKILISEVNKKKKPGASKIEQVKIDEFNPQDIAEGRYSNEFFKNCTTDDVDEAIKIFKEMCMQSRSSFLYELKDNTGSDNDAILPLQDKERTSGGFVDRDIQKKTIDNFKKALKSGKKQMLMYAVMRFGKTYVACRCAQEMPKNRFTVIVTAKPGVRNEWTGTVNVNSEFAGYDMYDATNGVGGISEMLKKWAETAKDENGNPESATLERYFAHDENKDRHIMVFISLQDLFGNEETFKLTKKSKDKHMCFYDYPVDLMIIDEAHYGTQTGKYGHIINEFDNPKLRAVMDILNLKNAVKLYLSGTPYNLLMNGSKFKDDEIISTYGFYDIIEAKKRWDKEHQKEIEDKNNKLSWEDNPYFGTPEMLEYGYNLKDFKIGNYVDSYTSKFEDLFRCVKDESGHLKFKFEEDIIKIFEILDGTKTEDGVMSFLDVEEIKKGNMCKHIVITLPSTASCDALEELLVSHRDYFKNFGEYQIIKASSSKKSVINPDKVKRLILSNVKAGNKTITLTCDRLLTGVTIKPWDTMFFMKDCASAQEYDQAKFRIMTPYVKKVKSIDVNEEGKPVSGDPTKVNMKPQVLFVDFHPDRIVEMKDQRFRVEEITGDGKTVSKGWENKFVERLNREKGSITLLLLKDGKFVKADSVDVGERALEIRNRNAIAMSFDEIFNELDKMDDASEKEMQFMVRHGVKGTGKDGKMTKKQLIDLLNNTDTSTEFPQSTDGGDSDADREDYTPEDVTCDSDYDGDYTGDAGNSDSDVEETEEERNARLEEERKKVEKARQKAAKACRKTIARDILMYLLLKNRGSRAKIKGKETLTEGDDENNYDVVTTINEFSDIYDSFNHYTGFDRKNVKDSPIEKIPRQMIENDKIICSIFCEDMGIEEPDYDDPYDVSSKVKEVHQFLKAWNDMLGLKSKLILSSSWSNMQLKQKYLEKMGGNDYKKLRDLLSKYNRLGDVDIVTPDTVCPKMFENFVIFNKKDEPKILDVYGGKIGEIFNQIVVDKHFKKLSMEKKLNNYYLICRTKTLAELNFYTIKKYLGGDRTAKRQWFDEHILVYDCLKNVNDDMDTVEGLENAINNKWKDKVKDMQWDIVVGNPPYGKDGNGSNKRLHFQILNTILDFVKKGGYVNFIMPSKCLYDMNMNWERNILKNAVCTDILIQNKSTFNGTKMPETAIYLCNRNDESKYSSKLDVQDVFNNSLNSTEKKYVQYFNVGSIFKKTFTYKVKSGEARKYNSVDEYIDYVISNKLNNSYYLNMCYASGNFTGTYTPGYYISPEQITTGVLSLDEQKKYISNNRKSKRWIGFEDEKYGVNLLSLIQRPIMRFGLWLVQDTYTMEGKCYKYFPDCDYSTIKTDEDLLNALGCTDPVEQKEILDYVNNFDFTKKRNDRFLKSDDEVKLESKPVEPEVPEDYSDERDGMEKSDSFESPEDDPRDSMI